MEKSVYGEKLDMMFPGGDSRGLSNAILEQGSHARTLQWSSRLSCVLVLKQKEAGSPFLGTSTASSRLPKDVGVGQQQSRLNGASDQQLEL